MGIISIVPWKDEDLAPVMDLWQRVFAGRKYDFRMDEAGFRKRVLAHPDFDPEGALIARVESRVVGFALALAPGPGETGYLSVLMVDSDFRHKGVGGMLLDAAEGFLAGRGSTEMRIGYKGNPISFATGVDVKTPAYTFFLNWGFRNRGSLSLFMETTFAEFELREEIEGFIENKPISRHPVRDVRSRTSGGAVWVYGGTVPGWLGGFCERMYGWRSAISRADRDGRAGGGGFCRADPGGRGWKRRFYRDRDTSGLPAGQDRYGAVQFDVCGVQETGCGTQYTPYGTEQSGSGDLFRRRIQGAASGGLWPRETVGVIRSYTVSARARELTRNFKTVVMLLLEHPLG